MSEITLEALGLTQEELQERVVSKACDRLLNCSYFDYDYGQEYEFTGDSPFSKEIDKRIKDEIEKKFDQIAETHILPHITERIQNLIVHQTNEYGEKKGESMTLVEYLVEKAEDFMLEEVDYNGNPQGKRKSWERMDPEKTRLAHQIHQYLHNHIEKAMKEVVGSANKTISEALAETCKIQLTNISQKLKVSVTTK